MALDPWADGVLGIPPIAPEKTFNHRLGLEWLELDACSARVRFLVREELKRGDGLLHGGVYAAVAETIASMATARQVLPHGHSAMGLNNSASILAAVRGGTLEVSARLIGRDESSWLWSHEFRDEQERLCAEVHVMIAVRPRPVER